MAEIKDIQRETEEEKKKGEGGEGGGEVGREGRRDAGREVKIEKKKWI